MILENRIKAFAELGKHLHQISDEAMQNLVAGARQENPWFTEDNIKMAIRGIGATLEYAKLKTWTKNYWLDPPTPKTVALVLAGNIPLVGFHDLLSVLISGHRVQLKLSSKDSTLMRYVIKHLQWLEPSFEDRITVQDNTLHHFDAVIATGSDNTSRYFESYFSKYPHIIRKNRTSCAILTGLETDEELQNLGTDIFSYFGLGCRNVSKLFIPEGFTVQTLLEAWTEFNPIIHHNKYCNNYDYQKSILLINRIPFFDNGYVLLQQSEKLVSPISVLYFDYYADTHDLNTKLAPFGEKIQCLVGKEEPATIAFGQAQFPELWDYADQIDTLKFLSALSTIN
jgi:hypothetical protein